MRLVLLSTVLIISGLSGVVSAYSYGSNIKIIIMFITELYILSMMFLVANVSLYFAAPNVFDNSIKFIPNIKIFVSDKNSFIKSIKYGIKSITIVVVYIFLPYILSSLAALIFINHYKIM